MYQTKIKITFADLDPAGILFYANIFKHAHSAYEEMIENFNLKRNYFFDSELAVPLIHAEADYVKPIKVGELLSVIIVVSTLKNNSYELTYKFYNREDLKATVKTVHVFVKKENFKKANIPEELYIKLEANQV